MPSFDFHCPTRIVHGPGRLPELGELARSLGDVERVMVVSDPGVVAAGHTVRGIASLEQAGLQTRLFDGLRENPTTDHVDAGLAVAREFRPDAIIAIGGGSSMDCGKGVNFLYSCGGRMQDYWGVGKATGPLLPMIAVPTTSGTGSETQSFALISDAHTHRKMACGDKRAAFRVALLDPELTITQPPRVTALTGIDAIAHTLETLVTTKRNGMSAAFTREAWRLLSQGFPRVLAKPNDLTARSWMQLGACYAGLAIENSMLGAAHALANPLTASFGVVHGEAVGLMLPHVIRKNAAADGVPLAYQEVDAMISYPAGRDPDGAVEHLASFVTSLAAEAGLATRLADLDVPRERLPALAADATQQWTGTFNPLALSESDFLELYEAAY